MKRSKRARKTMDRREYKILMTAPEPWWDEGISFYPKWRPGKKNPNKTLMSYQVRMYRSWKHNRKTQWKQKF